MRWWLIGLVAIGFLVEVAYLRKRQGRQQAADLVPRWREFLASDPVITPAKVPPVKPLKGVRVDQFARFRRRCQ